MFSLVFLLLFPIFVGVLVMVAYFAFNQDDLALTTKILVLADTFWKTSFFTFIAIGVVTLASAAVGSDEKTDWVRKFWAREKISLVFTEVSLNIKSWQATGFILKPLGLYVLGSFLFVTQIVLKEGINSGSGWLNLQSLEKENKRCFFIEQVDWQTALAAPKVLHLSEEGTDFSIMDNFTWAWSPTCKWSRRCKLNATGIDFYEKNTTNIVSYIHALYGQYVRRTPPSQCYGAEWILPLPAYNVPKQDFGLDEVNRSHPQFRNFTFAPAYLGGEGPPWNHAMFFTDSIRTACHYECTAWAEESAVNKLLELGMVMGGGMAIIAVSNSIGGYLGNPLVDRDTKTTELAKVILGDIRVLFVAFPKLFCWPPKAEHQKYFGYAWLAVIKLISKLIVGLLIILRLYRPMVVKYSESMADRGLVRCIVYVSLFNTALRSMYCFTKEMWNTGEDSGFHLFVQKGLNNEKGGSFTNKSYDLYNWMRLPVEQVIDLLFDYTYNLGPDELGNDNNVYVKMRFETQEDSWKIAKGAEGWIIKHRGFGALYEGSKVFVHFKSGVTKEKRTSEVDDSRRDTELMQRNKTWNGHKIPVEPSLLAEAGSEKDDRQVELKEFLGFSHSTEAGSP